MKMAAETRQFQLAAAPSVLAILRDPQRQLKFLFMNFKDPHYFEFNFSKTILMVPLLK